MVASSLRPEKHLSSSSHSEYELPAFAPTSLTDAVSSIHAYKNSRRRYLFLAKNCLSFCSFLALFVLFASLAANTCFFSVLFAFLLLATLAGGSHSVTIVFSAVVIAIQTAYALLYTVSEAIPTEA